MYDPARGYPSVVPYVLYRDPARAPGQRQRPRRDCRRSPRRLPGSLAEARRCRRDRGVRVPGSRALYDQMARIVLTPDWAKILDFQTPAPDFVRRLAAEKGLGPPS